MTLMEALRRAIAALEQQGQHEAAEMVEELRAWVEAQGEDLPL